MKKQTDKLSDEPQWTNLPWSDFLSISLSVPPAPPLQVQGSILGPLHISLGPFIPESFADTGDATIGSMHCDDSQ